MANMSRRVLGVAALMLLTFPVLGLWSCRSEGRGGTDHGQTAKQMYYCPMHPHYRSDKPGNCPICSMKLVPLEATPPPEVAAAPAPKGAPPAIRIAPERQQQIGVKLATAASQPAVVEIRATGKVAYDETRIAHVHTKVSGWIEEVFVAFVGASVKRGQPLFTLYSPELVASQEEYLLALRAERELGGSSLPRAAEGSRSLLEASRRRLQLWDLTAEQIAALEKSGQVSRTVTIHSSVSGVVTEREAYHHGRTVTPEMDLYTIVDVSHVWVLAEVYEYEISHLRVGQAGEAQLPYDTERKPLTGKVTFIAPFLDPKTRTVQVRLEFDNPGLALKPEAFVNVLLRRDLGRRLVIPRDALMDTARAQYVFVDKGDGYFEPREVKVGPEVAAGRVVTEGLTEGERIVTAANFILDSESRLKGAFDAMGRPAAAAPAAAAASVSLSIEVATDPSPPKAGRNRFRVKVRDARGEPVAGAEASLRLFMPAMPGMAPMEVRGVLKAGAPGEYAGDLEIPSHGSWSTTVTVRKDGQVIGTAETTVTAR
jgi:Cu(I)/Ag(I) efflux system membrane fusion protein